MGKVMSLLKNLKPALVVLVAVLILVIFRTSGHNNFKPDVKKWAEPSFTGSNILTPEKIASLSGNKLFISIDGFKPVDSPETKSIQPEALLLTDNVKMMKNHKGPVIIMSSGSSTSSKIWMILSQIGIKDLYILSDNSDNEVFKYKFQPDTLSGPEL